MASSSGEKRGYPKRLYAEGKSPIQRRSMHNNCSLSSFGMMKDYIGTELYNDIADNTQVGVILKLADSGYVWCAKHVHYLLTHQLAIERAHEIWFLIEGNPMRFSLYEFANITGLNCDPIDEEDKVDVDHRELWALIGVDPSVGPNWKELVEAVRKCRTWDRDKRKMVALLFILNVGIEGKSRSTRIPLEYAKRVLDEEAFNKFPWGRVGFKSLVDSVKVVSLANDSYVTHGCVHVLYIWALENIHVLGKVHGHRNEGVLVPLLKWGGGRGRFNIAQFLEREKMKNKKLEVTPMVAKPLEEIYPLWPNENAVYGEGVGENQLLDNLIHDIIHGCVDETAWVDPQPCPDMLKKKSKRKMVEQEVSEDDFVDSPPLKYRGHKTKRIEKKCEGSKKSKTVRDEEEDEEDDVESHSLIFKVEGLVKLIGVVAGKLDGLETNVVGRLDDIDCKLVGLETEVELLKKRGGDGDKGDDEAESTLRGGDAEKETSAMKENSEGFPYSSVVRNRKAKAEDIANSTVKVEVGVGRQIKTETCEALESKKSVVRKEKVSKFVDLSEEYKTPIRPINPSTFSDQKERMQQIEFSAALEKMLAIATNQDYKPRKGRTLNLAATQLDPYIGSSVVKRMIEGSVLSEAVYDPFLKVEWAKVEKLMDFIKKDLKNPVDTSNSAADFYLKIMTPKELWPPQQMTYGWLWDVHLAAAMNMFRKRSMAPTTPFVTDKLAFLDPWFVNQWAHDYKKFDKEKKWKFPQEYFEMYEGKTPKYNMTYKRWVRDVNWLYLIHNVGQNHWVALQVDLQIRRIRVYDSIIGSYSDDEVYASCKPYTRMIPLLLRAAAPPEERKKISARAFTIYRMKTAPQNIQEGDCGLYALKYIECLALGLHFVGLCDAAMPAIRLKLAAEMLDEVPNS